MDTKNADATKMDIDQMLATSDHVTSQMQKGSDYATELIHAIHSLPLDKQRSVEKHINDLVETMSKEERDIYIKTLVTHKWHIQFWCHIKSNVDATEYVDNIRRFSDHSAVAQYLWNVILTNGPFHIIKGVNKSTFVVFTSNHWVRQKSLWLSICNHHPTKFIELGNQNLISGSYNHEIACSRVWKEIIQTIGKTSTEFPYRLTPDEFNMIVPKTITHQDISLLACQELLEFLPFTIYFNNRYIFCSVMSNSLRPKNSKCSST